MLQQPVHRRNLRLSAARDVAAALSGSWRAEPPAPVLTAERLDAAAPILLASGSGALAWWRIRDDPALASSGAGRQLAEAFRSHSASAAAWNARLEQIAAAFRAAGLDPVLIKGWDCARLYPSSGLRPFGDVDLWLPAEQLDAAARVAATLPPGCIVDFDHRELDGMTGFAARAETVSIGASIVRVACEEDRLAILAMHFVKHGGWRPLWLCDIAAAVESRNPGFDWDLCYTPGREWTACTIALAARLLDANVSGIPLGRFADGIPPWIERAVLQAWTKPNPSLRPPLPSRMHPMRMVRGGIARWPSPIEASFARRPTPALRTPVGAQIADFTVRAWHRLTGTVR